MTCCFKENIKFHLSRIKGNLEKLKDLCHKNGRLSWRLQSRLLLLVDYTDVLMLQRKLHGNHVFHYDWVIQHNAEKWRAVKMSHWATLWYSERKNYWIYSSFKQIYYHGASRFILKYSWTKYSRYRYELEKNILLTIACFFIFLSLSENIWECGRMILITSVSVTDFFQLLHSSLSLTREEKKREGKGHFKN